MSVESLIKRVQKRIRELEKRSKISSIFESFDGKFPPNHTGLVIIYPEPTPQTPLTPVSATSTP